MRSDRLIVPVTQCYGEPLLEQGAQFPGRRPRSRVGVIHVRVIALDFAAIEDRFHRSLFQRARTRSSTRPSAPKSATTIADGSRTKCNPVHVPVATISFALRP